MEDNLNMKKIFGVDNIKVSVPLKGLSLLAAIVLLLSSVPQLKGVTDQISHDIYDFDSRFFYKTPKVYKDNNITSFSQSLERKNPSLWKPDHVDEQQDFMLGEFIIKFTSDANLNIQSSIDGVVTTGVSSIDDLNKQYHLISMEKIFKTRDDVNISLDLSTIYKCSVPKKSDIISITEAYQCDPFVEYAEPNFIRHISGFPIDPDFCYQWSLYNTGSGESIFIKDECTFDADIDAPEAWNVETGDGNVTIAVIDTGVDYNHDDLIENIWINDNEIPDNGIDDDGNNFVDDYYGYDFCTRGQERDNDPMDEHNHGTHCAGIAGAKSDNVVVQHIHREGEALAGNEKQVNLAGGDIDDGWQYQSNSPYKKKKIILTCPDSNILYHRDLIRFYHGYGHYTWGFGSMNPLFEAPSPNPTGIAVVNERYWVSDPSLDQIYEIILLPDGQTVKGDFFPSPGPEPRGLEWDGTNFWNVEASTNTVYKLTHNGSIVDSFHAPDSETWGVTVGGGFIWVSGSATDKTYKMDGNGSVVSEFDTGLILWWGCQGDCNKRTMPRGLMWDNETGFIINVDDGSWSDSHVPEFGCCFIVDPTPRDEYFNRGIAGVSWNCKIMSIRSFDSGGYGTDTDAADAIIYASDNGADVISMSWGSDSSSQYIQDAVDYAYETGVVLVAAAGNYDTDEEHYPAAYENVIAVAATDENDRRAFFGCWGSCYYSNYGEWIGVSAPGRNIVSMALNNDYATYSGTSMACPHVAGLAALIISHFPEYSNAMVIERIITTTDNIDSPNPGFEGLLGTGRINAYKALTFENATLPTSSPLVWVDKANKDGPWDGTPKHPYWSINEGAYAVEENGTVNVQNGTYVESVSLFKPANLLGMDKNTTILEYGKSSPMYILADGVTIKEFTIQNAGNLIDYEPGTIQAPGIWLLSSHNNVEDTIIKDGIDVGICNAHWGYPEEEFPLHDNTFNNNSIKNHSTGIFVRDSDNNSIYGNKIIHNFYGITLAETSNNNTIVDNTIAHNIETGIYLINCWYDDIMTHNSIFQNTIENSKYGIYIYKCDYQNEGNITSNKFYHNNFINNIIHAYDPFINCWDDGYPSGGNYWTNYSGSDRYRGPYQNISGCDRIGDTPYNISGGDNQDRYPLMNPYPFIDLMISNLSAERISQTMMKN